MQAYAAAADGLRDAVAQINAARTSISFLHRFEMARDPAGRVIAHECHLGGGGPLRFDHRGLSSNDRGALMPLLDAIATLPVEPEYLPLEPSSIEESEVAAVAA